MTQMQAISTQGMDSGVGAGRDIGLSTARSPSPMLPRPSLVKAAESRAPPMNFAPPPPLPKGFMPEQMVLEELVAQ
jgi:hypothetical protein